MYDHSPKGPMAIHRMVNGRPQEWFAFHLVLFPFRFCRTEVFSFPAQPVSRLHTKSLHIDTVPIVVVIVEGPESTWRHTSESWCNIDPLRGLILLNTINSPRPYAPWTGDL